MDSSSDRLDYLRTGKAQGCTRCELHQGRNQLVFGTGSPGAAIMLVGEGPGYDENRTGEPFTGDAGAILNGLLRRVELPRTDVYIANMVKCRPPGNRNPKEKEVAACVPFLHMQIRIVRPRVIVALGGVAGQYLSGESEDARVGYLRKHDWMYCNDVTAVQCPLVVTYHPSYILHQRGNKKGAKTAALMIMADLQRAILIAEGFSSPSSA